MDTSRCGCHIVASYKRFETVLFSFVLMQVCRLPQEYSEQTYQIPMEVSIFWRKHEGAQAQARVGISVVPYLQQMGTQQSGKAYGICHAYKVFEVTGTALGDCRQSREKLYD